MKVALVHQLPLEIYPPAVNALAILAAEEGWEVRAWSSAGAGGMPVYQHPAVAVSRPPYPGAACGSGVRLAGFARWHWRVGGELARWRPDAILAVEPHSALAVWLYYRWHGGKARLFIHHHEYYAPADLRKPGNRTTRICHRFEQADLFGRAAWVSETNETRLRLLMADCPAVTAAKGRVWPNHPPRAWLGRVARRAPASGGPLRLVCVGSLSFEDTFIREVAEWVAARPGQVALHVCGHNVRRDVWDWLGSLGAANISCQPAGCPYQELPELLARFDVGLVLYKGNTLNFVHNVPNKAVEGLVCGLEVWYPPEMAGMRDFQARHPGLALREVDFRRLAEMAVPAVRVAPAPDELVAERAMQPLLDSLREGS
jgi:hypothetical protein